MSKYKLPEGYDPIQVLHDEILSLSWDASDFEKRHDLLYILYFDSISDYEKPKDEQRFCRDLNNIIHELFMEVYEKLDRTRQYMHKRHIKQVCSSCSVVFPPDAMDYYLSTHGVTVKFVCPECRKKKPVDKITVM